MKKTLSHICVLLPLALVLAACEPETRIVEMPVEVEVTRVVEMPVEVEVSRVVEMPVEVEVSRVGRENRDSRRRETSGRNRNSAGHG